MYDSVLVTNDKANPVPVTNAVTDAALVLLAAALQVAQGATATALTGPITQGVVIDPPGKYLDSEARALSLTSDGRLRVSAAPAVLDFFGDVSAVSATDPTGVRFFTSSPWGV